MRAMYLMVVNLIPQKALFGSPSTLCIRLVILIKCMQATQQPEGTAEGTTECFSANFYTGSLKELPKEEPTVIRSRNYHNKSEHSPAGNVIPHDLLYQSIHRRLSRQQKLL